MSANSAIIAKCRWDLSIGTWPPPSDRAAVVIEHKSRFLLEADGIRQLDLADSAARLVGQAGDCNVELVVTAVWPTSKCSKGIKKFF